MEARAHGDKRDWETVPAGVRAAVERSLGGEVAAASTQPGGFSPGTAARVELADGRRAFVKAVDEAVNAQSAAMHREEAGVLESLPRLGSVPRLIDHVEVDGWVALVLEDVDGRAPRTDWPEEDLTRVLQGLEELAGALTPSPIAAPTISERLGGEFRGWRSFAQEPSRLTTVPAGWVRERCDELAAIESTWEEAAAGETLLHADLRGDQMILAPDRLVVVDWSSVGIGAAWVDLVFLYPSITLEGGPEPEVLLGRCASTRQADPARLTAVVAAVAGYFWWHAQLPPPPGIQKVRAFQRAQGEVALRWLADRLDRLHA